MQLNKFTDYALRILMYIARPRDIPYTIAEIAQDLQVSQNHLVKIVHFMAKQDWLITTRGKGGGIRLHPQALEQRLGDMVRILEGDTPIVQCHNPPCVLRVNCGLKGILDHALQQFYDDLNRYQLGEVLQNAPTATPSSTKSAIEFLSIDATAP
ncbi:RrF2 family transcriptional regulator [Acinetobacter larvae]|uniref:Transcriptional regulator n=1 Tax=Acinetobacter larvae TaxID=1789224 RepID=A0A1B2LWE9_9GAMM|nr:Rrf2 family transcriptional regulator [Acinetobacter larvae]AOA57254.1 transcriptional regulator [Acinetobacter larvae]